MRSRLRASLLALLCAVPVHAGVTNPDISVIGQPTLTWTDDPGSLARKRPVFDVGETEFVFDAALNPYARGFFALSFADGEAAVEEGYFTLNRGLPGGLVLKGGKYRVGFGKLNPSHPHAYPFAERFGVLKAYLPGEESFNETGMDLSYRIPLPVDWSLTASADVLQGDSFRLPRVPSALPSDPLVLDPDQGDRAGEPRSAYVGRLAAFLPVDDRSGLELGVSATEGTNNVASGARTRVVGGDLKGKFWTNANAYLLVQGEFLALHRETTDWAANRYTLRDQDRNGFYLFADYNWAQRYNAGASFESFQDVIKGRDQHAFGAFAGLALMEETTAFRLDYRHTQPADQPGFTPDAIQQLTLRVIFSMGPHKAHQF